MRTRENRDRLGRLAHAFHEIAQGRGDLKVERPVGGESGGRDGEARAVFRVRMRSSSGGARARLYVHADGAVLRARSGVTGAGRKAASDQLDIDLGRDYRWADRTFGNAGEMASVLVKRMQRQLRAVGGASSA